MRIRCPAGLKRVQHLPAKQPENHTSDRPSPRRCGGIPGDISGDAVNIASRIQSLAEDGGISVTRQVYDQVQNKFDLPLKSLGSRSLKNVSAPIEVYKMVLPWEKEQKNITAQLETSRVAVLPFANMSPDPSDSYFADG